MPSLPLTNNTNTSTTPSPPSPKLTTIPLTAYLYTRLSQLGCRTLHGVPGDYNLTALDHCCTPTSISTSTPFSKPLTYLGSPSELTAAYSADGHARITGLSAVITAFGVGELSALNAIAGAYAEQVALVHIVGTPPRAAQRAGLCLHHSLGDGDFGVFARMASVVTVAQVDLGRVGEDDGDEEVMLCEIDRVLRECVLQSRPVYIALPTDMVHLRVDAARLASPINTLLTVTPEAAKAEQEILNRLLARIREARQPLVIIDGFVARWSIFSEIDTLVRLLRWPTTSTPFGKSCVDETLPNFHGIYAGIAGRSVYKPWVDACDLVLRFGGLDSDVNTYGFSTLPPEKATVNFHRDSVVFGDDGGEEKVVTANVPIRPLLRKLNVRLREMETRGQIPRMEPYPNHLGDPRAELADLPPPDPQARIEQHDFWRRISAFFREGDVILTETGTPSVGSREFVLPRNARLINSSIWLSIGFMMAAACGAAMGVREILQQDREKGDVVNGDGLRSEQEEEKRGDEGVEPNAGTDSISIRNEPQTRNVLSSSTASGRTILFEGDGSFQMTAQELSTVIRHKLDLTLFLINNDGYTIERFIHGMEAHYNDVARWRYLDAPYFFGADMTGGGEERGWDGVSTGDEDEEGVVANGTADGEGAHDGVFDAAPSEPQAKVNGHPQNEKLRTQGQEYPIQTHQARTWGDLLRILDSEAVKSGKGLCMIEVFMNREDAPESLKRLVANVVRRNSGQSDGDGRMEAAEGRAVEEKVLKAAG